MKMRAILSCVLLGSMMALAADKTVYVNLGKAFDEYYKTLASNISLESSKQAAEDQLQLIKKELDSLNEEGVKLEKEMRNELVGQDIREAAARKLQACVERFRAKGAEFEKTRMESAQKIQQMRTEREEALLKEIVAMVNTIGDEVKATTIIDVSGKTFNRIETFLRYPKDQEITDSLIVRLNAGHEAEIKSAKAELEKMQKAREAAMKANTKPASGK